METHKNATKFYNSFVWMQLVQQVTTFPMEDEFEYEGCAIYNMIVELIKNYPSNRDNRSSDFTFQFHIIQQ